MSLLIILNLRKSRLFKCNNCSISLGIGPVKELPSACFKTNKIEIFNLDWSQNAVLRIGLCISFRYLPKLSSFKFDNLPISVGIVPIKPLPSACFSKRK